MLVLGLVETALELVPPELSKHPLVIASAQDRGKPPEAILLDEAYHAKALQTIQDAEKRGRPDIAHRSLLTALDSVLAREGQLELFVHTYPGKLIRIKQGTRLPRRASRFIGLMEQLLAKTRVPVTGTPLLTIHSGTLETYLQEVNPSKTFLLAKDGDPSTPRQFAELLLAEANPVVLVGGFAHGNTSANLNRLVDQQVSIDPELLSTSTVVGMLIHSIENASGLAQHRFNGAR